MSKLGEVSTSLFHFSSIGLSISCCLALETQQSSSSRAHTDVYGVCGGVFFLTWSPLNCVLLFCRAWASAHQQSPAASEAGPTHSVGFHLFYPPLHVFPVLLKGKHIMYVYFTTSIFERHIPLCSKESMWSGIWFAQWAKKNRCLLKPWARIWVSLSFFQTLAIAHFMAILCVHICGALEKARALPSLRLVLTDQIKKQRSVVGMRSVI